ncbi:MAG: chalcone isomerase family protein [Deltaproteobacteria bacterium]
MPLTFPARASLCAILLLLAPAPALAREVGGVQVVETLELGGKTLRLNGAGVRSKFFFGIYVGALYLTTSTDDPEKILNSDAPWEITLVFLREVDHEQLLDAFREAFEANNPQDEVAGLNASLMKIHDEVMSTLLIRPGQKIRLAYRPGLGSTVTVPGGASSRVPGKRFADALLRTWIGDHPSDVSLKDALLGKS